MKYTPDQLLVTGKSGVFELLSVTRKPICHDGIVIAVAYTAVVKETDRSKSAALGLTPLQAVQRAVEKLNAT
jgi:hypothetical protein